ncbi:DUF4173 domain-containing protein [Candidatus Dojkabacteria bacterium]|nr:DUF4173 domain-containing protein [Candidatus Dojkabacteria bacterium]
MLSSADDVFARFVGDFIKNTFGVWFGTIDALFSTLGKIFVGFLVFMFTSVFSYSIFNRDSFISKIWDKIDWMSFKNWKRDWDFTITSAFMFFINLLFIAFVVVQFVYLFGGASNVVGLKANFTYADYARRGFLELIVTSSLVFLLSFILNFKVNADTVLKKIFYRINHVLMSLLVLVMTYSATSRLLLYESVYGFTNTRLLVHVAIAVIALMYILLYISLLSKKGEQFTNVSASVLVLVVFSMFIAVPMDYVSAKLNYNRYLTTKKLDFGYMNSLSDEAVPVLIEISRNDKVDAGVRDIVKAQLQYRYKMNMKNEKIPWQGINFLFNKNKQDAKNEIGDTDWIQKAQDSLNLFIKGYIATMAEGKFDDAYANYWTTAAAKVDLDGTTVRILSFTPVEKTYSISEWLSPTASIFVDANVEYSWDSSKDTYQYFQSSSNVEQLLIINENGNWKIKSADVFPLGTVNGDKGQLKGWPSVVGYPLVLPGV